MAEEQIKSFIPFYRQKLKCLDDDFDEVFLEILHMDRKGIDTKNPAAYAVGLAYIAVVLSNQKVTQKQIADAGGYSTVTVRNRYMDIKKRTDFDPSGWFEKYENKHRKQ